MTPDILAHILKDACEIKKIDEYRLTLTIIFQDN